MDVLAYLQTALEKPLDPTIVDRTLSTHWLLIFFFVFYILITQILEMICPFFLLLFQNLYGGPGFDLPTQQTTGFLRSLFPPKSS